VVPAGTQPTSAPRVAVFESAWCARSAAAVSNCSVAVAESDTRAAPIDANPSSAVSSSSSVLTETPAPSRSATAFRYWVTVSRRSVEGAGVNTAALGGFVPSSPLGSPPGGITGTLGAPGTPAAPVLVDPAVPVPVPAPALPEPPPLIWPRAHAPPRARSPVSANSFAWTFGRSVKGNLQLRKRAPPRTPVRHPRYPDD